MDDITCLFGFIVGVILAAAIIIRSIRRESSILIVHIIVALIVFVLSVEIGC